MNRTAHEIEPEEVMAYLDGELGASRAGEVAAHIADCAACSAVAADFCAISEKLADWTVAGPTDALTKVIGYVTQVARKADRPRTGVLSRVGQVMRGRPWKIATAFGALAALALVAVTFLQPMYMAKRVASSSSNTDLYLYSPNPGLTLSAGSAAPTGRNRATVVSGNTAAEDSDAQSAEREKTATVDRAPTTGPMIARTAAMNLVVAKLDPARALLEKLLARHRGFASAMTLDKSNDASASLDATLQVPAAELDSVLGELRGLGRVTTESQGGEDVSDQHVDLAARLHNEREAEQRLIEILRTRTGKLSDVVEVEEQISQTRGAIEQMEAQLANLDKRVAYASIKLQIAEEYKAPAATGNGSVGLRLRNAIVGGYRDAIESLIGLLAFVLNAGPMIVLWGFILFWPARAIWRRRGFLRAAFGKS